MPKQLWYTELEHRKGKHSCPGKHSEVTVEVHFTYFKFLDNSFESLVANRQQWAIKKKEAPASVNLGSVT